MKGLVTEHDCARMLVESIRLALFPGLLTLVSCPDHPPPPPPPPPPEGRDGLVNKVEFLGLITGMW